MQQPVSRGKFSFVRINANHLQEISIKTLQPNEVQISMHRTPRLTDRLIPARTFNLFLEMIICRFFIFKTSPFACQRFTKGGRQCDQ